MTNISQSALEKWIRDVEADLNAESDSALPNRMNKQERIAQKSLLAKLAWAAQSGSLTPASHQVDLVGALRNLIYSTEMILATRPIDVMIGDAAWQHLAEAKAALTGNGSDKWLIWSNEHSAWWRANAQGYCASIDDAGRYTLEDAIGYSNSRSYDGKRPSEIPIRLDIALRIRSMQPSPNSPAGGEGK